MFEEIWRKLSGSREYRSSFAKAQFKRLVPFQIRELRKQRGWNQEQLAQRANVTQGVVSRAEDSNYGNLTVNTILKIADGFDAVFVGRFVPYSEFIKWYEDPTEPFKKVPSFEEENRQFQDSRQLQQLEHQLRDAGIVFDDYLQSPRPRNSDEETYLSGQERISSSELWMSMRGRHFDEIRSSAPC